MNGSRSKELKDASKKRKQRSQTEIEKKCMFIDASKPRRPFPFRVSRRQKKPPRYVYTLCPLRWKESLLARGNEHALFLRVVGPSARSRFAAVLLREPLDPLLEFGSEMPDETL